MLRRGWGVVGAGARRFQSNAPSSRDLRRFKRPPQPVDKPVQVGTPPVAKYKSWREWYSEARKQAGVDERLVKRVMVFSAPFYLVIAFNLGQLVAERWYMEDQPQPNDDQ